MLHESVARGEISASVARERLARFRKMPIRLLGDAVLQRRAWEAADQLGWTETYTAEYVALTQLHGDALVTLDPDVAQGLDGIVRVAGVDDVR